MKVDLKFQQQSISGCDELCEGRKPTPSEPGARKVKTFEKLLFHFLT